MSTAKKGWPGAHGRKRHIDKEQRPKVGHKVGLGWLSLMKNSPLQALSKLELSPDPYTALERQASEF